MRKIAIILYGPPGSGKGTQANLLADKLGLIHFDTGKFLESIWYDPKRQKEKLVQKEKKIFEEGGLNSWSFVAKEIIKDIKNIAGANRGLIFSGSPRTLPEAKLELPVLEKLYRRKNIFIFVLKLSPAMSIKRNSARLMCRVCGYGLLTAYYSVKNPKTCPICGGEFRKRTLDKPEIIKVRLKTYHDQTEPVFGFLKKRGYKLRELDAAPAPYKVLGQILKRTKL